MSREAFSTTRGFYSPSSTSSRSLPLQQENTLPLALRRAGSPVDLAAEDLKYTVKMATPKPNLKELLTGPKFTGGSASRWLRQLKAQLITAGYDIVPPDVHARTIDLMIDVSISEAFESDSRYKGIVDDYSTATAEDVVYMEDLIKQYFPDSAARVKASPSDQLDALAQEKAEPMESYYNRVLALLRQFGGRDARGNQPLTAIEQNTLRMLVKAFIKGVNSSRLRSEASKKGALTASSLHDAYNLIVDAQLQLELEEQEEREAQVSEKAKAYDALLRGRTPQQVASMLANTNIRPPRSGPYIPPPARAPYPPSHEVTAPPIQSQNQYQNQPQNQNPGGYTGYANPPPAGYARPTQNTGYGRGNGSNGGFNNGGTAARGNFGNGYGRGGYNSGGNNSGGYNGGYNNNGGNGGGNGGGQNRNRMAEPNAALSNHPIVNGSQPFYREMGILCPKCGEIGHRQDTCVGPELAGWEQYILRGKIREVVAANAGGNANANHVNLHVQEPFQYRQNPGAPEYLRQPVTAQQQEPEHALPEELTIDELRNLSRNHHIQGASVELIMSGELPPPERSNKSKSKKAKKGKRKEKVSLQAYLGEGKRGPTELTEEELEREFMPKVPRLDIYDPGQHTRPTIQEQMDAHLRQQQPQPHTEPEVQPSHRIHPPRQPVQPAAPAAPAYVSPYAQSEPEPPQEPPKAASPMVIPPRYVPPPVRPSAPVPAVPAVPVPVPRPAPQPATEPATEPPIAPATLALPIRKKRVTKQLKQIVGRIGLEPINYKDVMQDFKVTLSLMDLMQISPDFAKNVRQLSTRANEKKKRIDPSAMIACISLSANQAETLNAGSSTLHPSGYPRFIPVQSDDKAFRIPAKSRVTLDGKPVTVNLKGLTCIADQGSDINIVTYSIVQTLGLETYMVSPKKDFALHMGTADGKTSPLTRFTIMTVGVNGIWRQIYAFIRPTASTDRHLLLGLPWLHDVNAVIDIRSSTISIGDFARGEAHTVIQGPAYALLTSHKLTLAPLDPKYKNWVTAANVGGDMRADMTKPSFTREDQSDEVEDMSGSEDSEETDSDESESGSETDTETASTILAGNSGN